MQQNRSAKISVVPPHNSCPGATVASRSRIALLGFATAFFVLWTALLTISKSAQIIHFDSAEAYAWGQQLAWGYGKHPPASGWLAWVWFSFFPARDWAVYALAMTVTASTFFMLWILAGRIVDRPRSSLTAYLLLLYPIVSFKGYKYNSDLLLLPCIVLAALAAMAAFERRTVLSSIGLGLACASAMLTKYWGGWVVVAICVAALSIPERKGLFASPVPYVAASVFVVALIPHVLWLVHADFAPLRYPLMYTDVSASLALTHVLTGTLHAIALLLPPLVGAFVALWPSPVFDRQAWNSPSELTTRQRVVCIIVAVLALLPPLAAAALRVNMKSDWLIPMYTMVPLAILACYRLVISDRVVIRAATLVLAYCLVAALVVPSLNLLKYRFQPHLAELRQLDEVARISTEIWHKHFRGKLPVVVGWVPYAAPITFYSPDHPRLFSEADPTLAPWIDPRALDETGFIGICAFSDARCLARIGALRPATERFQLTTKRSAGDLAVSDVWVLLLAPPGRILPVPNRDPNPSP